MREGERAQAGIGADVRGRLLAADVLLARRERQHEAAPAFGVDRLADEPARHLPHEFLPRREQARHRARRRSARCRSTAPRRPRCRRPSRPAASTSAERDHLGDHRDQQRAGRVRLLGERPRGRAAGRTRPGSARRRRRRSSSIVSRRSSAAPCGGGSATTSSLGQPRHRLDRLDDSADAGCRLSTALLPLGDAVRHQHRLGGRGRAVIHRGVGDLHAGQHRDLGLELEQIMQRALRDLGLVRRVGGEELRALDQVIDARRHVVLVGAAADEERHRSRPRRSCAAMRPSTRSTSISALACAAGRAARRSRLSAGMSANRSSMSATPMRASISARSSASAADSAFRSPDGRSRETTCALHHDFALHRVGDEAFLVREVMQLVAVARGVGRFSPANAIAGASVTLETHILPRSFLVITPTASSA